MTTRKEVKTNKKFSLSQIRSQLRVPIPICITDTHLKEAQDFIIKYKEVRPLFLID